MPRVRRFIFHLLVPAIAAVIGTACKSRTATSETSGAGIISGKSVPGSPLTNPKLPSRGPSKKADSVAAPDFRGALGPGSPGDHAMKVSAPPPPPGSGYGRRGGRESLSPEKPATDLH